MEKKVELEDSVNVLIHSALPKSQLTMCIKTTVHLNTICVKVRHLFRDLKL